MGPGGSEDDLTKWTLFLREYSRGNEGPLPRPPGQPHATIAHSVPSALAFGAPLYPLGEISTETARAVAQFYEQQGFLPPPRADGEAVRLQTIQEYNLFRQDQIENFNRCSSLVKSFFPFAPICTISLFHRTEAVVSQVGKLPGKRGAAFDAETTISGHVLLTKAGQTTELCQVADDWRFARNPRIVGSNGVKGYIGVPVTLEIDPSNPQTSQRVTVAVISLMSDQPFRRLTDTQRRVLDDLSSMLSVQLRSNWEGSRRGKEMRLRNAVSLFLETALVDLSHQAIKHTTATLAEPPVEGSEPGKSTPNLRGMDALTSSIFSSAAEQLQQLLDADSAIIIDLSAFHATNTNDNQKRVHSWVDERSSKPNAKWILGSSSSALSTDLESHFNLPDAMAAVAGFLDTFFGTGRSIFTGAGGRSGLEELLSGTGLHGSQSLTAVPHIALPLYTANHPNLLIVVASTSSSFTFNPADLTFVSNLGVVLVAHLAQRMIVEADAAKTAFVSQISHEIRTPLHGLLGQLDLVRDSFALGELSAVPALLDSAEYCGTALRHIVNDVLDFGKMTSLDPGDTNVRPEPVLVDLAQVTLQSARSCWLRRQQWQKISAASASNSSLDLELPDNVNLVVEYENRSRLKNWWISLDASGFIRILNNLVTNSLKYTEKGLITVSLVCGPGANDSQQITLRVQDTGRGITPEFMQKIFDPFTQADSFSPGAGLGLHITKSVVERMGGSIAIESPSSGGTIFTVVLPVENIELAPPNEPCLMRRKWISSELLSPEGVLSPQLEINKTLSPTTSLVPPSNLKPLTSVAPVKESDNDPHLTILVVDDNAISRKILVAMLKRLNTTTHQADDGINAMDVFRKVHPDVVWTDVSMPRMDGVTAAGEMRKIERELGWNPSHIVAITGLGLSDEQVRREALLGPAALDAWLIKGQTNLTTMKENLFTLRQKLRFPPRQ
ncbi:hypothetical protein C8F04DRAFT_1104053 [Mycena alexandri]|uniref:histidine kinase n=1 Tax=Mycena alexandri TaxID=1745969 RepID=A0AAD6SU46_9AGAR|nr:hypothetical protein C8F04DRAFT_1104053 [Mycena alexandri]